MPQHQSTTDDGFILGSVPLFNPRHDEFAVQMATGKVSALEAYKAVYGDGLDTEGARVSASRLLTNAGIIDRIKFLRGEGAKACVMTLAELMNFHASVIRAPIGEVDASSPLCQEQTITEGEKHTTTKIKVSAKAASAAELAKLCGWYAAEKVEAVVSQAGPDELAERIQQRMLELHGTADAVQKVLDAAKSA